MKYEIIYKATLKCQNIINLVFTVESVESPRGLSTWKRGLISEESEGEKPDQGGQSSSM